MNPFVRSVIWRYKCDFYKAELCLILNGPLKQSSTKCSFDFQNAELWLKMLIIPSTVQALESFLTILNCACATQLIHGLAIKVVLRAIN